MSLVLIHNEQFRVATFDVDQRESMTITAIARYLQETSHLHSDRLGSSAGQLLHNQFWMMAGLRIRMIRYPRWREEIRIETYPTAFEQIFGRRDFTLYDAESNVCGIAAQRWMIIDIERRRPVRIPEHIRALVPQFPKEPHPLIFDEAHTHAPTAIAETSYQVRQSDIDMNHHANHTAYIKWALDELPDTIHQTKVLEHIAIDFRLECMLHDTVQLAVYPRTDVLAEDETVSFVHLLTNHEKLSARVISSWKNAPILP